MDFGSVLYKAQLNEQNAKDKKWYKTSFPPPKKDPVNKRLSVNIRKFLEKKEDEEKRKKAEAELKKQNLLTLRKEDKKSSKRVQSMLNRTKSANKSVLEDAVGNTSTDVTKAGILQPDEDDYGYVSNEVAALYDKMVNKYTSEITEETHSAKSSIKSSAELCNTKDRVKANLLKEKEESKGPRKRKSKSSESGAQLETNNCGNASDDEISSCRSPENKKSSNDIPAKKKRPLSNPPPVIDFQSLLKIAEKKQFEPIVIERKEKEDDRPLTKKEKLEKMRLTEKREPRETKINETVVKNKNQTSKSRFEISKTDKRVVSPIRKDIKKIKEEIIEKPKIKEEIVEKPKINSSKESLSELELRKIVLENQRLRQENELIKKEKDELLQSKLSKIADEKNKLKPALKQVEEKHKLIKNINEKRPKINIADKSKSLEHLKDGMQFKSQSKSETKLNGSSIRPQNKLNSPNVNNNRYSNINQNSGAGHTNRLKSAPHPARSLKKRHVIESDEEVDSDMDDFIDDSEDPNDYSKYISEIFGYDKSKYSNMNDDEDECMESNFSQLQKEEFISTKYGILEDLADIRKTKEEKKKKSNRIG